MSGRSLAFAFVCDISNTLPLPSTSFLLSTLSSSISSAPLQWPSHIYSPSTSHYPLYIYALSYLVLYFELHSHPFAIQSLFLARTYNCQLPVHHEIDFE